MAFAHPAEDVHKDELGDERALLEQQLMKQGSLGALQKWVKVL